MIICFKNIDIETTALSCSLISKHFTLSFQKVFLMKVLKYARSFFTISKEGAIIIMRYRKSFVFNNTSVSMKRQDDRGFQVAVGSFDSVEVFELVVFYALNLLDEKYGKERVALYRHDGLACF